MSLAEDTYLPRSLQSIFNNAVINCMLLINEQGIIMSINKAFSRSFGYEPADIVGAPASILFTPEDQAQGLPAKELSAVLNTGQGNDNNYLVSKEGNRIWVSGESIKTVDDNNRIIIVKIIQNIHVQKEAAREITDLYQFNEKVLAEIDDAVVVIGEDMQIVKFNDAFQEIFKPEVKAEDKVNFQQLLLPHDTTGILANQINKAFITRQKFKEVIASINIEGAESRMYDISGSLLQTSDEKPDMLMVFHDITVQQQLIKEREDIIGFVAHEIRNPLSNIGLCNELMIIATEGKDYGQLPELIRRNTNNIKRLTKMTAELYNATKTSSGILVLETDKYHFGDMIAEAVETTTTLQPAYTINITGETNFVVEGDRYRMMEVVHNFLSNGIKYSNGKTGISITISKENDKVTVAVKDNGLGIPAAQLPFIFEKFFRAEKTKDLEGLGLGLYLCQRIIRAHGGQVWAESEEGKGSVFYFSVPLRIN